MFFLEFKEIEKRYKERIILTGINFKIKKGEIFGLVGASGCGKTTLLKILIGITDADKGEILFDNKNVIFKPDYLRKETGFASQENTLFDELTVKENALYFGGLYGLKRNEIEKKLKELLKLLNLELTENFLVNQLSGGMKKRANLLVSLIHDPNLLILDEPTVGLDSILRETLWNHILEINKRGTTIIVTSHLLDEIEKNCDRIAILKDGAIISVASPDEYKKEYGRNKSFTEIFELILKNC